MSTELLKVAREELRLRYVGTNAKRVEDLRLLTGNARYLDDFHYPHTYHAKFVRSPYPHARIGKINFESLTEEDGVVYTLTGKDIAGIVRPPGNVPGAWKALSVFPLAVDKVRYVGEPLAVLVAKDRGAAEDAVEKVDVEYEELPCVTDTEAALKPDAPLLFEDWGTNSMGTERFESGNVESAFERAHHVVKERFVSHRYTGVPIEGRGCISSLDRGTGELTLYTSTQWPHLVRSFLSESLSYPESRIRVVSPDVGGGFGVKNHFYSEELVLALLGLKTGLTIKWVEDRSEHMVATNHAREQIHYIELALNKSGIILGIRDKVIGDLGAGLLAPYFGIGPIRVTAFIVPSVYKVKDYECEINCVVTNKTPAGAYRGYGQPEGVFAIERVLDIAAAELRLDPIEFRLKNLVKKEDLPYVTATGNPLETGSFVESFLLAAKLIDYNGFRKRQLSERGKGRLLGISVIPYMEGTAPVLFGLNGMNGGYDSATVRMEPDGHLSVATGICGTGSGLETSLAQVAADAVGVRLEAVTVRQGDTSTAPFGLGTWGSRSLVVAGGSIVLASEKLVAKILKIAARLKDRPESDLHIEDGYLKDRKEEFDPFPVAEIARIAYLDNSKLPSDLEPTLEYTAHFDPSLVADTASGAGSRSRWVATVGNGAFAVVVEIDPSTGGVKIVDSVIVDDCGKVVNPQIVEGQLHGGVAQGIGGALLEDLLYNNEGQLLSGTLTDYLLPTSTDVPDIRTAHIESPSVNVPLGFKGVGEAGVIAPPVAIANAIADALPELRRSILRSHMKPEYIWSLLKEKGKTGDLTISSSKAPG